MLEIITDAEARSREDVRGALPAGTRLKIYDLVSVLGQGGFAITYLARDTLLNRDVAIKEYLPTSLALRDEGTMVLPRSTALAAEFIWGRERFLEEARTLAKLGDAPSIVRVHDYLEANGTAYMVMALARGETLQTRRSSRGNLGAAEVERILYQLLDGLEEVHAAGFLHRDIKPANIVLDAKDNPTLIDFGASRAAIADGTSAMTAIFTPGYAAMEQFTSARQGPWTDIYGLAATLYYAITGTVPPTATDRILEDTYRPLRSIMPAGFAQPLLSGLDAALEVRADRRPQDIAQWREILRQPGVDLSSAPTQVMRSVPPRPAPERSGRGLLLWAAIAFGVFAIAGTGYSLLQSPQPQHVATVIQAPPVAEVMQAPADHRAEQTAATDNEGQAVVSPRKPDEASPSQPTQAATQEKAEADAAAKLVAERKAIAQVAEAAQTAKRAAEAAEIALQLSVNDRKRLQVALTSLGHDTRGSDGVFGERSREMIAAWQIGNNLPETGFLTALQLPTLLSQGAPAVSRYDDEIRRATEASRKANDDARRPAIRTSPASPQVAQTPVPGALNSEPAPGQLAPGKRVLVDDGVCGPGQIKEVIGGGNIGRNNTGGAKRTVNCIARDVR